MDPQWLAYLGELPDRLTLTLGGTRLLMVHGAPWDEPGAVSATYLYPHDQQQLRRLESVEADVVILGHTHVPMARQVGKVLVINPGSCGEARGAPNELSCARLDLDTGGVDLITFKL